MNVPQVFWNGLQALLMYFALDVYFHFVYAEAIAQNKTYIRFWSMVSDFTKQGMPEFGALSFLSLITCCFMNYYLTVSFSHIGLSLV